MGIELVRIDDRLIHGQVVTTWVKQKEIEQILIINDKIANDPVQKSVFDLMAPQDVNVRTFGVDEFIQITKKTQIKRKTLLLLTNPKDVLDLKRGEIHFSKLNLGGMKFTPDRKQYTKSISLTDEDKADLIQLSELNVDISVQMIPSDKPILLLELLGKEE
ncbi:PTS system mannose/fructose/N-acetylgalactosamine-transporter subunit IIB [Listeria booriae]|uniref:PTS sugar transporter subunit IIB n=1 Tax=Listeria booriae TaxID=1552123 RepID=A0A7X0YK30_9LIST|nr:PTS sugar transporter subunit IIB [Listeria booriae]MBC1357256.1 PTS sugar transporter subunit IIB [Listeria booriae]MBC2115931.1 PTS sugar transporter subunit IIB [Listeria booriae]